MSSLVVSSNGVGALRRLRVARDSRITARVALGDREAFGELYRRYHQDVFRYALAMLADADDAADVLQTTMVKALRTLGEGQIVKSPRAWLLTIAHRSAIDQIRARPATSERVEPDSQPGPGHHDPAVAAEQAESMAALLGDIGSLPERQRSALVLRELSGLSHEQIAAVLATTSAASRQLVSTARRGLHEREIGRAASCRSAQEAILAAEGRLPRLRALRAHAKHCPECRAFRTELRLRPRRLALAAPPLAPLAASQILSGVLGGGPGSGGATAGAVATGSGKAAAISGSQVAAAVVSLSVVAGALAATERLVHDGSKHVQSAPAPNAAVLPLLPKMPPLRALPRSQSLLGSRPARRPTSGERPPTASRPRPATPPTIPVALPVQSQPALPSPAVAAPPGLDALTRELHRLLDLALSGELSREAQRRLVEVATVVDPKLGSLLRRQFSDDLGAKGQRRLKVRLKRWGLPNIVPEVPSVEPVPPAVPTPPNVNVPPVTGPTPPTPPVPPLPLAPPPVPPALAVPLAAAPRAPSERTAPAPPPTTEPQGTPPAAAPQGSPAPSEQPQPAPAPAPQAGSDQPPASQPPASQPPAGSGQADPPPPSNDEGHRARRSAT